MLAEAGQLDGQSQSTTLRLKINQALWASPVFKHIFEVYQAGQELIIGSPVMLWYSYVHFDVSGSSFTFVPRAGLDEFMESFLASGGKALASAASDARELGGLMAAFVLFF